MSVNNRSLDNTEQRKVFSLQLAATGTGVTTFVAQIPYNSVLEKAQFAAYGLSGAPTFQLYVNRFIVGTGFTTFAVSAASAVPEFGTSGVIGVGASLLATGSTLLNLVTNDIITLTTGVANTAVKGLSVNLVVRPLQDVKTHFNLI